VTTRLSYEVTLSGGTFAGITRSASVRRVEGGPEGAAVYEVVLADGAVRRIDVRRPEPGVLNLLMEGRSVECGVVPTDEGFDIDVSGAFAEVQVVDPRKKALRTAAGAGGGALRTQMPGRVVRVLVAEGDQVEKGQPMVVVEAMKMENELKAPAAGAVRRLLVKPGDLVEARAVLAELG